MSAATKQVEEDFCVALIRFTMQVQYLAHVNDEIEFALHHSRKALQTRSEEMFRRLGADNGKLAGGVRDLADEVGFEEIGEWGVDWSTKVCKQRVDSAVIVFLHSLLDTALFTFAEITFQLAPERWNDFVRERKIKVSDVVADSASAVQQIAQEYLRALERESLELKADRLCAVCRPKPKAEYVKGFEFSKDDLKSFDNLRHQIVHGAHFKSAGQNRDRYTKFALNCGVHFGKMVGATFGLNSKVPASRLAQRMQELA